MNKKYTLSDQLWNNPQEYSRKHKEKENGFGFGLTDLNGISRTMSSMDYKDGAKSVYRNLAVTIKDLTCCFNILFFSQREIFI
jgi:hypothetical protein